MKKSWQSRFRLRLLAYRTQNLDGQKSDCHYFNDKDPWMLGEDIPNSDFFFSQIWLSNFVNEFKRFTGRAYKKILCIYRGYHYWFYYGEKDSNAVGENIVNKIAKNSKFAQRVNSEIVAWSRKLRAYVEKLPQENLSRFSNKQLWQYFIGHDRVHTDYYCWGWISVAADMFHNNYTFRLKEHLRKIGIAEEKINEYLVILTQPTKKSLIQIEQEEFLKIGQAVQKDKKQFKLFLELWKEFKKRDVKLFGFKTHSKEYEELFEKRVGKIKEKISPQIYKLLEKHYLKYFYTKYLFTERQGVYSFDYYLKELVRLVASGDLMKKHQEIQREFKKGLQKKAALIKKLGIKDGWKTIFDAFGDFMITKIFRRYAQIYALYRMEPVLREIGKRLGLTLMQVKFMLPQETKEFLLSKSPSAGSGSKREILKRIKLCVYYAEKGEDIIFIGKKAKKLVAVAQKLKIEEAREIKGQCGCVGRARGKVKIINTFFDMAKMRRGDILVSIMTQPDLVPAMKKAAAIVTDQGGVTSHAAIVARELRTPCLIGTKIATKVLRDGQLVEVDATKGIVRKIINQ